jgi:hypothetical protein
MARSLDEGIVLDGTLENIPVDLRNSLVGERRDGSLTEAQVRRPRRLPKPASLAGSTPCRVIGRSPSIFIRKQMDTKFLEE